MTKRFAILNAQGKALNVCEFELPLTVFVWPGYGAHWIYADTGARPAAPPVIDPRVTYLNAVAQGPVSPGDTVNLRTGVVTPLTPPVPPPPTKDELRVYATEKRVQVEAGGCPWNGNVVLTDPESQIKLLAEFVAIGASLRTDPTLWKMSGNNFISMTNEQMGLMVLAVRNHVVAAFNIEADLMETIESGLTTTYAQIDAANWPSNG